MMKPFAHQHYIVQRNPDGTPAMELQQLAEPIGGMPMSSEPSNEHSGRSGGTFFTFQRIFTKQNIFTKRYKILNLRPGGFVDIVF